MSVTAVFVCGWLVGAATVLVLCAIRRPPRVAITLPPANARQIRRAMRRARMELPREKDA